jgi:hypothetical protein
MTDMDALDRLIATEVERASAPSRPVDDAAIFAAITASRTPRLRLGFAFSAAKYVMAIGILALFGGFLLTGILSTPEVVEDPAAESESPSPAVVFGGGSAFPTGTFVSEDGTTLEFREDGTCVRAGTPCTFGTSGNMYVEMTFEDPSGPQRPAAYSWRFDGEQLTFERWDGDLRQDRLDTYVNHVYRPVGDTQPFQTGESDFPTGWFRSADHPEARIKFVDDGVWSVVGWIGDESEGGGTYTVNGDLFTTATPTGWLDYYPATFYWDLDGEQLTFRVWGEEEHTVWPEMDEVWVRDVTAEPTRRLSLSAPNLDYFVTVEISVLADGRYSVTATILEGFEEKPLGEGVGDTPQEAVRAALAELGEPVASDLAEKVPG